jgi:hypothetical protein
MRANTKAQFRVKSITSLDEARKTHPYPKYHPVTANSCTDLMEYLVQISSNNPDEVIYVCEDDYLHLPHAMTAMKALFNPEYNGFYAPYDYPDRYTIDTSRQCEVHVWNYGHLRSIPSATLTIAAKGSTWLKYTFELLRAGAFADDSWTWKAFRQSGALCPIPGHATHLQDGCIAPFVDWESVYGRISTSS